VLEIEVPETEVLETEVLETEAPETEVLETEVIEMKSLETAQSVIAIMAAAPLPFMLSRQYKDDGYINPRGGLRFRLETIH
jgi:hypothetical protein